MKEQVIHLAYEIELRRREKLTLPPALVESVGEGRMAHPPFSPFAPSVRSHDAFLSGGRAGRRGFVR